MDVQLVMFKDDSQCKEFPLVAGTTNVGRSEECDLRIPLPEVSRKHAAVIVTSDDVTLRDLGSANGTYVNNQKITEQELAAGDHVVIGPVVFTVRIDGEPEEVRPVQTRLEAKSSSVVDAVITQKEPGRQTVRTDDDLFDEDEEDPISALEALAASDDTAAIDLDDSAFDDSDDTQL